MSICRHLEQRFHSLLQVPVCGEFLIFHRNQQIATHRRFDDAWMFAVESLEMASRSDSSKHIARARRLQVMVLAANGRLEDAVGALESSVTLAAQIGTHSDVWITRCSLGQVLLKLSRDREAEKQFVGALRTLEAITNNLQTPGLKKALLASRPVAELYSALARKPPITTLPPSRQ